MILLRVEYFQECSSGISVEVTVSHLVNLVQQKDRVRPSSTTKCLNDEAGTTSNICSAMAANFSLISYTTESDALEWPPQSFSDRLAQGGLPDSWRSNEEKNGAFDATFSTLGIRR
jgi:hypothetical protein